MCLGREKEKKEKEGGKKTGVGEKEKGRIVIGEPTEFRHVGTAAPMTRGRGQGVQLVDGESGWEDI